MADAFDPTDPRQLSPQQRFDELAAILAIGARRALALRRVEPPESEPNGLDVSAEKSVHAPVELTQSQSTKGVEA